MEESPECCQFRPRLLTSTSFKATEQLQTKVGQYFPCFSVSLLDFLFCDQQPWALNKTSCYFLGKINWNNPKNAKLRHNQSLLRGFSFSAKLSLPWRDVFWFKQYGPTLQPRPSLFGQDSLMVHACLIKIAHTPHPYQVHRKHVQDLLIRARMANHARTRHVCIYSKKWAQLCRHTVPGAGSSEGTLPLE